MQITLDIPDYCIETQLSDLKNKLQEEIEFYFRLGIEQTQQTKVETEKNAVNQKIDFYDLCYVADSVRPLLCWLYKPIAQEERDDFFLALCDFFEFYYEILKYSDLKEKELSFRIFCLMLFCVDIDNSKNEPKYIEVLYSSYKEILEKFHSDESYLFEDSCINYANIITNEMISIVISILLDIAIINMTKITIYII